MSIELLSTIWKKEIAGNQRSVLQVLCDFANDDGVCWPSISTVAWKVGCSEQTVRNVLVVLKSLDVVKIAEEGRGRNNTNMYVIDLDALPDKPPRNGDPGKPLKPQNENLKNLKNGTENLKQLFDPNRHIEPSEKEPSLVVDHDRPDGVPFSDDESIDDDIDQVDTADAAATTEQPSTSKPKTKPRAKAQRAIPDDWQPTADERQYAIDHGIPAHAVDRTVEEFRNYWLSDGRTKANWGMTWRNRILQIESRTTARAETIAQHPPRLTKTSGETVVRKMERIGEDWTARSNNR